MSAYPIQKWFRGTWGLNRYEFAFESTPQRWKKNHECRGSTDVEEESLLDCQ